MIPGMYLDARIAFAFYALAWLCFIVAALLPAGRGPAVFARLNLLAFGLALAISPTMYVFFKYGFHRQSFFH